MALSTLPPGAPPQGLSHPPRSSEPGALATVNPRLEEFVLGDARDPAYNFRLSIPRTAVGGPAGGAAGAGLVAGETPVLLASFERRSPPLWIEVYGARVEREIEPEDFLDGSEILAGAVVVSRRPSLGTGGVRGDVLSTTPDRVGRCFATKSGTSMFVVSCRTPAPHYDEVAAQDILSIGESFEPLEPAPSPYAEPMTPLHEKPLGWKWTLPSAWQVKEDGRGDDAVSYQASRIRTEPEPELVGKLTLCIVSRHLAKRASDLAAEYLAAVERNDIVVSRRNFAEEAASNPFLQSWLLHTPVSRREVEGELWCRVLLHDRAWVLAGMLSPKREDDGPAWMENKRALNIAVTTLERLD